MRCRLKWLTSPAEQSWPLQEPARRQRRSIAALVSLLWLALALAACSRPSKADCEKACRHHVDLWSKADIKGDTPEKQQAIEAERAAWKANRDDPETPGLFACVRSCTKRGKKSQVSCILKAEAFEQAKSCWDD